MDIKAFIENETSISLNDALKKLGMSSVDELDELNHTDARNVLSLFRSILDYKEHTYPAFLEAYEKPYFRPLQFPIDTENLTQLQRAGRENVYSRTKTPKPKIAFLGRSNAGKSTMINSFLGVKLLPTSWNPTTSAILYVKHIEDRPAFIENSVCFFKKGDGINEWDESKLYDKAHYDEWLLENGSIELITTLGTHLENNNPEHIGAAVVFIDCPLLKGCDLLDTPGLTMGMEEDVANSTRAVDLADAYVYLYPANASFIAEDENVIMHILEKNSSLESQLSRLFVVATQVDMLANDSFTPDDYSTVSNHIEDNACNVISKHILDTYEEIIEKYAKGDSAVEYMGKPRRWGGVFAENGKKMARILTERTKLEFPLQENLKFLKFMPNSGIHPAMREQERLEDELRQRFFAYSTKIRFDERTYFEEAFESFLCSEAEKRRDNKRIDLFCESFLFGEENLNANISKKTRQKRPIVIKCKDHRDERIIFMRTVSHAFKSGEDIAVLCLLQKNRPTIEGVLNDVFRENYENTLPFDKYKSEWESRVKVLDFEAPIENLVCDKMIIPMFWRDGMPKENEFAYEEEDCYYSYDDYEEDRFDNVDEIHKKSLYDYMISAKESLCITYWGIPNSLIRDFKWGTYSYLDSDGKKLDQNGREIEGTIAKATSHTNTVTTYTNFAASTYDDIKHCPHCGAPLREVENGKALGCPNWKVTCQGFYKKIT